METRELRGTRVYEWLRSLGLRDSDIVRVVRLAAKSTIVRIGDEEAVVAVPSQRLIIYHREKIVEHIDLASLLSGRKYETTLTRVGDLPTSQQTYLVQIAQGRAYCQCPATVLGHAPLCSHRLAAAVKLYEAGRGDLLGWLTKKLVRKWYLWRKKLGQRISMFKQNTPMHMK